MLKESILKSQLKAAKTVWEEIQNEKSAADRLLKNFFLKHKSKFGSRDRRFITEIIFSLFRNRSFYSVWKDSLKKSPDSDFFLLLAAFFENLISKDDFKKDAELLHVVPPEEVWEAFKKGDLPKSAQPSSKAEEWALRYSYPVWLLDRWISAYGEPVMEKMIPAMHSRAPLVIRANPLKCPRERLIGLLADEGVQYSKTKQSSLGVIIHNRVNLSDMKIYNKGLVEVQDEGSQIVCQMLRPKPGETIWDVCAGSGGKSLLLASMMKNKGRIIATDPRVSKLEELKKRAARAGAFNIFPAEISKMPELKVAKNGFDKILVDAPCSGTGTLRRNPDIKWRITEEDFKNYHLTQVGIIENCLPYLNKGGQLYYCTCSIDPAENEETINAVLAKHDDLILLKQDYAEDGTYLKLNPYDHGTDGYFLAILRRKKDRP